MVVGMTLKKHKQNIGFFDIFNTFLMFIVIIIILVPYVYVFMVSITNEILVDNMLSKEVKYTFDAYVRVLFKNSDFFQALGVSVGRTVIGTFLNMLFTCLLAYPLSKKDLPGKNIIITFIVITMFFGGGLIPSYLLISSLKLTNNYLVYLLPGLVSAWYAIILRNFIETIPDSMQESAKIDGASEYRILFQIIIPLSMQALASLSLFYAVGHWNSWFDATIYMRDPEKYPLQVFLRRLVMENVNMGDLTGTRQTEDNPMKLVTPEAIKNASILVTTLPIVIVYPFLQKYFVKGIMIGAVKG